jgi:two-component system KDP operon response regulator KdpE
MAYGGGRFKGDMTEDLSQARTVLLVESDAKICRFILFILRKERYRVLTARDLRRVAPLIRAETPDLVILDLIPRDTGQLEICQELRASCDDPILVLTSNHEEQFLIDLLDNGADAYAIPPFNPEVLLARIRALLRHSAASDHSVIRSGDLELDLTRRRAALRDRPIRLTRKEFNILCYLARNGDRAVSTGMILENVWGPAPGDYTQSLRVHIGRIRRKIETDPSRPRYLVTERGGHYRLYGRPKRPKAR